MFVFLCIFFFLFSAEATWRDLSGMRHWAIGQKEAGLIPRQNLQR
jgi:hypothetical protein